MHEWYARGDKIFAEYREKVLKEFRRTRLTLPFDEINALTAKRAADRLYRRIDEMGRRAMLDVALNAYAEIYSDALPGREPYGAPNEDWLEEYLLSYNPVTRYVYVHELDRKRARFFESIVADAEAGNRIGIHMDYKTASSLWIKQTGQYIADVEDAAARKAFSDAGLARVRWKAELDGRECVICKKRHNRIYPIENVPEKPHYRCRCILIGVYDERGDAD